MSRLVTNLLRVSSVSPSAVWLGGAASSVKQFTSTATNAPPNRNKNDKSLITAADADNTLSYVSYENASKKSQSTPLIIQHALFGRKENLTSLGKKIHYVTKRSVIIPDARNHGNSPKCTNPSVKQMSSDLVNLQHQLQVDKASILGFNTGGRVAMMAALRNPKLIDRLVISSSTPLNTPDILKRWESSQQAAYIVHTIIKSHGISSKSEILNTDFNLKLEIDEALKSTLTDSSERALFLSNLGKFKLKCLMNNPDMGKFPNVEDKCFTGPVMFISGEKQPTWRNDEDVRQIKQLFPNSYFVKIPGAGYWAHIEKHDDFLSAVITFLETEF